MRKSTTRIVTEGILHGVLVTTSIMATTIGGLIVMAANDPNFDKKYRGK